MAKPTKHASGEPAKKDAAAVPPGYLPTANPPRKNGVLLALAVVFWAAWMLVLAYLALTA